MYICSQVLLGVCFLGLHVFPIPPNYEGMSPKEGTMNQKEMKHLAFFFGGDETSWEHICQLNHEQVHPIFQQ